MNDWPNLDELQFEKFGMPRNLLMVSIAIGLAVYFAVDALLQPSLQDAAGIMQLSPGAGSLALWWFVLVPTLRSWNERLPRGHFQGLADYYLFNPRTLEIANDPEPLPLYIPASLRARRAGRSAR